jgi:MFS family permease
MLIGARFAQGVGGAMTSAVILGMIALFPAGRTGARDRRLGSFVSAAGASLGLLAGVLTETLSWHWIFFVNLLIGLVTGFVALRLFDHEPGLGLATTPTPQARRSSPSADARRLHDPAVGRPRLGYAPDTGPSGRPSRCSPRSAGASNAPATRCCCSRSCATAT